MAFLKIATGLTVGLLAMLTASSAAALTIAFDDARFPVNTDPYQFYPGVTITNSRFGTTNQIAEGTGYGDPGNWDMAGTNGSVFLATNQAATVMTFAYDQAVTETTLDVGGPGDFFNPATASTFTGTAFLGGSQVGVFTTTVNASLRVSDGPGFWGTLTLTGVSFDSFTLSQAGFGGWGVDNVQVDLQAVPEPGSALLMGLGLAGLAGVRRREL
jgi:hypothetical protein